MSKKGKTARMATKVNLSKMSLAELEELQADVEHEIAAARERTKQELRAKFAEEANKAGIPLDELVGGKGRGRGKVSVSAAKYANPDNRSETWTGRGRKPNWLVDKLKKGGKIEDYAI